jgi:hypothetical protein
MCRDHRQVNAASWIDVAPNSSQLGNIVVKELHRGSANDE